MDAESAAAAPPEKTRNQKRRDLEAGRARALQSLQLACDPRRRAELERRIEDLDSELRTSAFTKVTAPRTPSGPIR